MADVPTPPGETGRAESVPEAAPAPNLMTGLADYFAARNQQRDAAVARRWEAMTRREQRLVREAAVMGYVRGVLSVPGGHSEKIPRNSEIVAHVIDACISMPDLYPYMTKLGRRRG